MATVTFTGKSGKKYEFEIYDINAEWNDNISAIYIVTKRQAKDDGGYSHNRIYIGRTKDLKERHGNHHQQNCFDKHNANRICIYQEKNEQKLIDIETDLIQGNTTKCNET